MLSLPAKMKILLILVSETGLSDYQKLISTFLKSRFLKATPKVIKYRNHENFDKNSFLNDLNNIKENPDQCFDLQTNSFLEVVNKHAHLKKIIRGNHAFFVNKNSVRIFIQEVD